MKTIADHTAKQTREAYRILYKMYKKILRKHPGCRLYTFMVMQHKDEIDRAFRKAGLQIEVNVFVGRYVVLLSTANRVYQYHGLCKGGNNEQ